VIRFSAFLVVVAVGLLVAGVVTSKLLLVYIAIGVSGAALLALGIGAAVNWRELTGKPKTDAAEASAQGPVPAPQVPAQQAQPGLQGYPRSVPAPAPAGVAPAGSGWPAAGPSGPSRAGYLPADAPLSPAPSTARPEAPARSVWERRDDPVPAPASPPAGQAAAPQKPAQEPGTPPSGDQPSAEDKPSENGQAPTDRQDDAKPEALASEPEPSAAAAAAAAEKTAAAEQAGATEQAHEAEAATPDPDLAVTVVPGVPRYHNARCILIRFMGDSDLDTMTLAAARQAGCTPCRACLPDQPEKSPE
jgi:hypothetical protein